MAKQDISQDRNFDDLAHRFARKIYGSLKGDIRLAVVERDLHQHTQLLSDQKNAEPLFILDAGGGQGQFSLGFAELGHQVVICDISSEMLALARKQVEEKGLSERVILLHCSLQEVGEKLQELGWQERTFDLVICHAVMEWLKEPANLLPHLLGYLKLNGFLSLIFYNVHSLIFKNLLRGNYRKVATHDVKGYRGSLTPINPIDPSDALAWVEALPFRLLAYSGIRVFHDYILDPMVAKQTPEEVIELELRFSQLEPYRSLGRYQHFLLQRHESS